METTLLQFRLAPGAVCRNLLARLQDYKPLAATDNDRIMRAIKSTGITNVEDRLAADIARQSVKEILRSL